jgi:hypothetical protein
VKPKEIIVGLLAGAQSLRMEVENLKTVEYSEKVYSPCENCLDNG